MRSTDLSWQNGATALILTAEHGHEVCAKILLDAGASKDDQCNIVRAVGSRMDGVVGGVVALGALGYFGASGAALTVRGAIDGEGMASVMLNFLWF